MSETPQSTWLGGAPRGNLWFCYAGPLAGRQKSGISGNQRRPKSTSWRGTVGKLGEEENEPATERRNRYHFSGPPGFRLAFYVSERNERFCRVQCERSKERSSTGKRKRPVFLCRRTVGVKVKSKVIPMSFLKIEGREPFVGAKDWRKRDS